MNLRTLVSLSPLNIAAIYLGFGVVWIASTDWLVVTLVSSPETVSRVQTIKGWVFVLLSAGLILGLLRVRDGQITSIQEKLARATEQLQVFHRFLRHNVRNDLTVIEGNIQLVEEHVDEEEIEARLTTARQTAEAMARTSEKMRIVDAVNLEPPSPDDEIDIVELTATEIDATRRKHPEVSITFDSPDSVPIRAKPSLHHAISELLENAITHNTKPPEQREVAVSIRRDGDQVTLMIADNGPGIDPADVVVLEARRETELMHASGVGLWIASWLTEYFDGRLHIDTRAEAGTTANMYFESPRSVTDRLSSRPA